LPRMSAVRCCGRRDQSWQLSGTSCSPSIRALQAWRTCARDCRVLSMAVLVAAEDVECVGNAFGRREGAKCDGEERVTVLIL
jgi:hypothetical protein